MLQEEKPDTVELEWQGVMLLTEPSLQSFKKKKKKKSHYVVQADLSLSILRFEASQELRL